MKTIMRNQLLPLLAGVLQPLHLLGGGKTLLAGVSGGADSVALLHGLVLLKESHDFSLAAVHVEHGLRGEESQKDASFVKDLCLKLQVPLLMYSVDAMSLKRLLHCGMEEAARVLRYDCFSKAMKEYRGDALLLAHHGDDQAETVLMHLMRGSGPAGLSGMALSTPYAGGLLVRPFLSLNHELLVQSLCEEGCAWREDETNAKPDSLRNRLRLKVLPVLKDLAPGCIKAIGRAAVLMAGEEEWWQSEAAKWLQSSARMEPRLCFMDREALHDRHPAFSRRMVRAFIEQAVTVMAQKTDEDMAVLSFDKTEEVLGSILRKGSSTVNLPGNIRGECSAKRFFLIPPAKGVQVQSVPLSLLGETQFESFLFAAKPWWPGMELGDGIRYQALNSRELTGAVFRTRRQGDTFRLLNGEGSKPLKEVLIDRNVDRPFRDMLPILARGPEVLWIPGVGPSDTAAIRPGTEDGTVLTLKGLLPWDIAKDN